MQAEKEIEILAAAHWDIDKLEQDLRCLPTYSNFRFSPLMLERLLLQLGGMSAAEIAAYKGCSQNAVAQSNQKLNGYLADLFPHSSMHIVAANYAKLLLPYQRSSWEYLKSCALPSKDIYPEAIYKGPKRAPFVLTGETTSQSLPKNIPNIYRVPKNEEIRLRFDRLAIAKTQALLILQSDSPLPQQLLPSHVAKDDPRYRYLPYYDHKHEGLRSDSEEIIDVLAVLYERDAPLEGIAQNMQRSEDKDAFIHLSVENMQTLILEKAQRHNDMMLYLVQFHIQGES